MNFKFIKPVYFNDSVQCTVTITRIEKSGRAEAEALFTNQHGEQVGYAHLKGYLPQAPERRLLQQMFEEGDPTNRLNNETYG
jgi:acyl dehydratase